MTYDVNTFTYLDNAELFVCDDCGARNKSISSIEHYSSCLPGSESNATACWKCKQVTMTLHGCYVCGADTEH